MSNSASDIAVKRRALCCLQVNEAFSKVISSCEPMKKQRQQCTQTRGVSLPPTTIGFGVEFELAKQFPWEGQK